MKITKTQAKKLLYEGFESNDGGEVRFVSSGLEDLLSQLLKQMKKLDLSIDYLAASVTGEDPLNIGQRQAVYGRAAGVRGGAGSLTKEGLTSNIARLVKESLEDRLGGPDEDETGWTPIPPEELHGALSEAIWDIYKYVNGIRPRGINFKEMSIEELEKMYHSLSAELEQQAQEDEAHAYKPDYEGDLNQGLEDRYISDHDAYEAEKERMMTPEKGENKPQRQGMGRRPLVGPARDVRRGRKISEDITSERLKEIIAEEYRKVLVENVTNIEFTEDELASICAALNGYDDAFHDSTAYQKLYDYYVDEMPYEIKTQHRSADKTLDEWILDQLTPKMIDGCAEAGEMHFLQEGKQKRRS